MLPVSPYLTEGLFIAVPFTLYTLSTYQGKIIRPTKRQNTQFNKREHASDQTKQGCWNYQTRSLKQP